jgi:ADP-ribose pyrophosphatase YjhB (NUDIX family)
MRPILGVLAVIIQDRKILLVKRRADPGRGRWSVPGGTVHLSEKVRDAALREVKEETGLDIEIADDRPLDVFDNIVTDENGRTHYHFTLLQFLAKIKGGSLKAAEDNAEARWVPLDDVKRYDLANAFKTFFEKHEEELSNISASV